MTQRNNEQMQKDRRIIKEYVRRMLLELEQRQDNNIIQAIVTKFPSDYALALGPALPLAFALPFALALPLGHAIASNKRDAFWERYNADEAFKKQMNSSYACKKQGWFDFWFDFLVVSSELREYLKPELKRAEVILIEEDKASALKINDVRSALEIAENVEEFIEMVKASVTSI